MLRKAAYNQTFVVADCDTFHPFPQYEDREKWAAMDSCYQIEVLRQAETYVGFHWPMIPAAAYREYYRNGNRTVAQNPYFVRRHGLSFLVQAECFLGDGRYLDDIINAVWCICEESSWVVPAHNFIYEEDPMNAQRTLPDPDMQMLDIFAGETAMSLAMVYYLLQEPLNREEPLVCRRIERELKKRIIDPFLTRYDYWWMGYSERRDINNWGPWCVVNCLTAILFVEKEPSRRRQGVVRALDMLSRYLEGIPADGGIDEGATYWGRSCGMLLEGLFLIQKVTSPNLIFWAEPKLRNFTRYLFNLYIAKDYVVNFADGAARTNPAAELIFSAGKAMGDEELAGFGAYLYQWQRKRGLFPTTSLSRSVRTLAAGKEMIQWAKTIALPVHLEIPSLEIMVARESPHPEKGFFLCAKGGSNGDSHNHNDVGQFVVFYDGNPFLIDIGVEVYTKQSFGPERYSIWTMQSAWHNLPTISEVMQREGGEYRAKDVRMEEGEAWSRMELNISGAYPAEANLKQYRRVFTLYRGESVITIDDCFSLAQAQSVAYHLVTAAVPEQTETGIFLRGSEASLFLAFSWDNRTVEIERVGLTDEKLTSSWGKELYRITIKEQQAKTEGSFVLKILPVANEVQEHEIINFN